MTLKHALPGILLCTLSTFQAFCQPKLPGYIISINGDTSQGFIQRKDLRITPRKIYFYNSANTTEGQEFGPGQIKSFAVLGDHPYHSFAGKINTDPVALDKLLYRNDKHFADIHEKNDTIFLKQLLNGKVKLYEMEDFKFHYFIQYGEGDIVELINKFHLVNGAGASDYKANNRIYLHQIDSLLTTNNIIISPERLQSTSYDGGELTKLLSDKNGVASSIIPVHRSHHNWLGAGAGVDFIHFTYFNPTVYADGFKGNSMGISEYVYYDFTELFNQKKLFGRFELAAQQLHCVANQPIGQKTVEHTQNLTNIGLTTSINYSVVQRGNFEIYAGAGIGVNFNLSNNSAPWNFGDTVYNSSGTPIYIYPYIEKHPVRPIWTNLNVHAGIIVSNKLDLNIQYVPLSAPGESDSDTGSRLHILSVRANYIFRL